MGLNLFRPDILTLEQSLVQKEKQIKYGKKNTNKTKQNEKTNKKTHTQIRYRN